MLGVLGRRVLLHDLAGETLREVDHLAVDATPGCFEEGECGRVLVELNADLGKDDLRVLLDLLQASLVHHGDGRERASDVGLGDGASGSSRCLTPSAPTTAATSSTWSCCFFGHIQSFLRLDLRRPELAPAAAALANRRSGRSSAWERCG